MPALAENVSISPHHHLQQDGGDGHEGGMSNNTPTPISVGPVCEYVRVNYQIDPAPAVICAMCFVFGIVYTFFGK